MNPRTTGLLLLVAATLGAFVYFELQGDDPGDDGDAERLFPVEVADLREIELTTSDGRQARLERVDGVWQLLSPVAFPADAFAADAIASGLSTLESEGAFEDPGPLAEYGLEGEASRSVRFTADGDSHELVLGADAPMGSKRYIAVAGEVHAVPRFELNAFEKSLDDLRNRDILDFDRSRVRRIGIRWPGGRVVLEREAGDEEGAQAEAGEWRLTSPLETRADQSQVADLLSDLDFLRADGFVDEPPETTGLQAPVFEATLSGPAGEEGEEAFEVSFAIGAELPSQREDEGGGLLVRGMGPGLYTIPTSRRDDFPRNLFAYRHKELARFSIADAEKVELYFQQRGADPVSVLIERDGSEWTSSPEPMDRDRILPMVSELSRLSASGILAESVGDAELSELELSPPNTIVTVLGEVPEDAESGESDAGPRLAELRLGKIDGSEGVVVQRAGDPVVYRLPIEVGDTLPLSLEAYRNRFQAPEEPEELPGEDPDELLPSPSEESP